MAGTGVALPASLTWNELAAPTTWALVTMSPCSSNTMPEPRSRVVVICTTEGNTLATTDT